MYVIKGSALRISVRNLVEFLCRGGDIDAGSGLGTDVTAMQEGARIHRLIQHRMGAKYHAEVPLKYKCDYDEYSISIEGRADGIICDMDEDEDGNKTPVSDVIIDEIKTMQTDVTKMKEAVYVHKAQAMCYAYIYATQHNLEKITVQMTYCNSETEEIKRFAEDFSYDEINKWYENLMKQFKKWTDFIFEQRQLRQESIGNLEFPFEYREGQRELVVSVYKTINRGKTLYIQAPTGVGKTIATIFPAVAAMGQNKADKIFYLTSKTITRTVAENTYVLLRENGLHFRTVTLTARDKICMAEKRECNPANCEYAKGHFDRVNAAVYELLTSTDEMSREVLEEQARKWNVCPFEMALDVSQWVDAVICDYNYVFDPNAHLKRFFGDGVKGEYLFLIDEAHNLVERGRTMYSTSICKEDFLKIKKLVKYGEPKLVSALENCNKQLLELKRECDGCQILNSVSHVYIKLLSLMTKLEEFIEDCKDEVIRKGVLEFYFGIRNFIYIHDRLDENYLIYSELSEEGKFYLHLFCVNPAGCLQEYMGKGNSTILFSATFLPINYYKKLLSAAKDDYAIYAESPFEQSKRLLLLGNDVSTKYTRRGPEMYRKYAEYMMRVIKGRTGNYLAFFPSYRFLEEVWETFMELPQEQIEVAVQSQYMTEQEREEFLKKFEQERAHSLIGFCVMGGIFSEGIDLTEDKLIGAMIIGTGLPQVCLERELLKYYFDRKNLNGFDYAYLYPGMNKVLQSAGRVIRTDQDRGVIALLDERFMDQRCQEVFPREWNDFQICNSENIEEKIAGFWKEEQMDKR